MRDVLDTNIIRASLFDKSPYHQIIKSLYDAQYDLFVTSEILLEYEEKIGELYGDMVCDSFIRALYELKNVHKIERVFRTNLIPQDPDDNKFIDCAYAGNVHLLVTNDKDFDVLKKIDFPKLTLMSITEFIDLLKIL